MSLTYASHMMQQHEFAFHVANSSEFGTIDCSNHSQLHFSSRPTRVQSLSFKSDRGAPSKNASSTILHEGFHARHFCSISCTEKSRQSRVEKLGCSGCRRLRLSMSAQCLCTDTSADSSDRHAGLTTTIERQVPGTEGTCSGSYADSGTLDQWLRDSVFEILRHLKEAPFIQFVHGSEAACQKPERQKISEEFFNSTGLWSAVKQSILQSSPIGLILVQKLDQQMLTRGCLAENVEGCEELSLPSTFNQNGEGITDVWGILVEGRNIVWNACYILKTTRVTSSTGICTHFCLTRAKCFGPSLQEQLEKFWLL